MVSDAYGGRITSDQAILTIQGFTATGNLLAPREEFTATLLQTGKVLVVGGYPCPDSCGRRNSSILCRARSPPLEDSSLGATIIQRRSSRTAWCSLRVASVPRARLRVQRHKQPNSTTLRAAPSRQATRWRPSTIPRQRRFSPVATSFIAGGAASTGEPTSVAECSIATGTFSAASSMISPRVGHSATLLPDGRVLIVGGLEGWPISTYVGTAEVYSPDSGAFTPTGPQRSPCETTPPRS